MVQVQIDLSEGQDKKLKMYMAIKNIKSKEEAIRTLIDEDVISKIIKDGADEIQDNTE